MSRAAPADAIVVLGHRVEADGRPGPELALRLERGMSLLRDARAPCLVCSGGRDDDEPVSAAESMIRVALAAGVEAHRLLAVPQPRTTLEEAVAFRIDLSGPRRWRRILLVTSDYHVPRAAAAFALALGPEVDVATEAVSGPFGDPSVLTRRESEGLLRLRTLAAELVPGDVAALAALAALAARMRGGCVADEASGAGP